MMRALRTTLVLKLKESIFAYERLVSQDKTCFHFWLQAFRIDDKNMFNPSISSFR